MRDLKGKTQDTARIDEMDIRIDVRISGNAFVRPDLLTRIFENLEMALYESDRSDIETVVRQLALSEGVRTLALQRLRQYDNNRCVVADAKKGSIVFGLFVCGSAVKVLETSLLETIEDVYRESGMPEKIRRILLKHIDEKAVEIIRQLNMVFKSRKINGEVAVRANDENPKYISLQITCSPTDPDLPGLISEELTQLGGYPRPRSPESASAPAALEPTMLEIPAGEFDMGSNRGDDNEKPVHRVKVPRFLISATPVTQAQYEAVTGHNPSFFKGEKLPVDNVSWNEAMHFCKKLSEQTGKSFTLPTEAQWEYASRAKSTAEYCFGNEDVHLGEYAWYGENSEGVTHPVGMKSPNDFGLYDMHGNVWEWCLDRYTDYSSESVTNPAIGSLRVLRGGSWSDPARHCRSACRCCNHPGFRADFYGFRVVLVPR